MDFKLIVKKIHNHLTKAEEDIFQNWYNESKLHQEYFAKAKDNYQNDKALIDVEKGWEQVSGKIQASPSKGSGFYLKYGVAASIILLLSISFYFNSHDKGVKVNVPSVNNISVGTNKATLTLGDGTSIDLEKGEKFALKNIESNGEELAYIAQKNEPEKIEYNYLTVPRGGQFVVLLSDSTKVWLNSETQIKYPVKFPKGQTREVQLVYGEAFFDVSPSTKHDGAKFKVKHDKQDVEVLGTKFNIKAYSGETNIYTTLLEGKVAVNIGAGQQHYLKPNQQSLLNIEENTLTVSDLDANIEVAWKDGVFNFDSVELKEIMKVLSRWYDMDVVFENKQLENQKFVGLLNKHYGIDEILEVMLNVNAIQSYKIDDKKITLK